MIERTTSLTNTVCEQLAQDRPVDQRELNRATDDAYDPKAAYQFQYSPQLEERLLGWMRAALRESKPRPYLRRLAMFKEHLQSKPLRGFLAEHFARYRAHGIPKDPLHLVAEQRISGDSEFWGLVVAAQEAIAASDKRARIEREGAEARCFLDSVAPMAKRLQEQFRKLNSIEDGLLPRKQRRDRAELAIKDAIVLPVLPHRLKSPKPSEEDFALCASWANVQHPSQVRTWEQLVISIGKETEAIKLLTARLGEKSALKWYRDIGHDAVDVSITQLDGRDKDAWMTHDILLDSRVKIDVKTARQSFVRGDNDVSYYSSFLVRHITDTVRRGDIRLCAVLTPYVSANAFAPTSSPSMLMLGEVRRDILTATAHWAERTLSGFRFQTPDTARMLPGWYFASEDLQRKVATHIARAREVYREAVAAEARLNLSDSILRLLEKGSECQEPWLQDLVDVVGRGPFAAVISMVASFTTWARGGAHGDWDSSIRDLFLPDAGFQDKVLLCADPGGYVDTFREALDAIARRADRVKLGRLQEFTLSGPGLLTALDPREHRKVTLLAYCGGVGCGFAPLVYGLHSNCRTCGKLACPREGCGFCSYQCPGEGESKIDRFH
jgi:hypothetical protein